MHFPHALYTHHTLYAYMHINRTVLLNVAVCYSLYFSLNQEGWTQVCRKRLMSPTPQRSNQPLRSSASSVPFLASLHVIIALACLYDNTEALLVCFLLVSFLLANFMQGEPVVSPSNSLLILMSPVIRYNLLVFLLCYFSVS